MIPTAKTESTKSEVVEIATAEIESLNPAHVEIGTTESESDLQISRTTDWEILEFKLVAVVFKSKFVACISAKWNFSESKPRMHASISAQIAHKS